jgi:hypothetical protein
MMQFPLLLILCWFNKGTNRAIAVSVIGVYTVRIEGISYKVIVE